MSNHFADKLNGKIAELVGTLNTLNGPDHGADGIYSELSKYVDFQRIKELWEGFLTPTFLGFPQSCPSSGVRVIIKSTINAPRKNQIWLILDTFRSILRLSDKKLTGYNVNKAFTVNHFCMGFKLEIRKT